MDQHDNQMEERESGAKHKSNIYHVIIDCNLVVNK